MTTKMNQNIGLAAIALLCLTGAASAKDIKVDTNAKVQASFDIIESRIDTDKGHAIFYTQVRADAGGATPNRTGEFAGSDF